MPYISSTIEVIDYRSKKKLGVLKKHKIYIPFKGSKKGTIVKDGRPVVWNARRKKWVYYVI